MYTIHMHCRQFDVYNYQAKKVKHPGSAGEYTAENRANRERTSDQESKGRQKTVYKIDLDIDVDVDTDRSGHIHRLGLGQATHDDTNLISRCTSHHTKTPPSTFAPSRIT